MTTDKIKNNTGLKLEGAKLIPLLFVFAICLILWFVPPPSGLSLKAWHLFAIFLSTIVGLIVKPLPMGAVALMAVAVCALTHTITLGEALSGFNSQIVWLIVIAFLLARGFIKTNLGSRIAYCFIVLLGKSTLGLAYGLTVTEFALSPFMPSNTARGGGIIYPIIMSLNKEYGSTPEQHTEKKIGSYLIKLLYQVNVVTSSMFMTAMAANPLVISLAGKAGVEITWGSWAVACIVPGVINLVALPLFVYWIYPPEMKQTPKAPEFARNKLREMGNLKLAEIIMLITFSVLLFLWIFGGKFGVGATTAAIVGLLMLLISGVLTWDDVVMEHNAWNTFIWMAILIMMSNQLNSAGLISWFGEGIEAWVGGFHWVPAFIIISIVYFYSQYLFASMTAHVTSMFSVLLMAAMAAGVPPAMAAMFLAASSGFCAGLTHYGTGSAPVFFGSNYVKIQDWWRIGALVSIVNMTIWLVFGVAWWKVIGLW